jgi:uncharacterized protein
MTKIHKLIDLVKPLYPGNDNAHDWAHIGRVSATARKLCLNQDVDEEVVLAAVYCHDIVNLAKDHPDRKNASTMAAETARPLLEAAGFSSEQISKIVAAVIEHSFSKGLSHSSLESAIVQDADRLDTLGAIGILRCASVSTQMGGKFYEPFDPLGKDRVLDDKAFMLDHYTTKLFKLPELMNTRSGRRLADERVAFMRSFVLQLESEIH